MQSSVPNRIAVAMKLPHFTGHRHGDKVPAIAGSKQKPSYAFIEGNDVTRFQAVWESGQKHAGPDGNFLGSDIVKILQDFTGSSMIHGWETKPENNTSAWNDHISMQWEHARIENTPCIHKSNICLKHHSICSCLLLTMLTMRCKLIALSLVRIWCRRLWSCGQLKIQGLEISPTIESMITSWNTQLARPLML